MSHDPAPWVMAKPGCYHQTPAPTTPHSPFSHVCAPSPRPGHKKPMSQDLRFDGKSSGRAFQYKFVRLAYSEQWSEWEQHDQICLALEGKTNDNYALMLETSPILRQMVILMEFE